MKRRETLDVALAASPPDVRYAQKTFDPRAAASPHDAGDAHKNLTLALRLRRPM